MPAPTLAFTHRRYDGGQADDVRAGPQDLSVQRADSIAASRRNGEDRVQCPPPFLLLATQRGTQHWPAPTRGPTTALPPPRDGPTDIRGERACRIPALLCRTRAKPPLRHLTSPPLKRDSEPPGPPVTTPSSAPRYKSWRAHLRGGGSARRRAGAGRGRRKRQRDSCRGTTLRGGLDILAPLKGNRTYRCRGRHVTMLLNHNPGTDYFSFSFMPVGVRDESNLAERALKEFRFCPARPRNLPVRSRPHSTIPDPGSTITSSYDTFSSRGS
jgi:hypothetical protein